MVDTAKKPNSISVPKARKRNRVPISCTICRRRKVKCDKGKPTCNNCKKNGVPHLCFYLQPSWAKDLEEDELKLPLTSSSTVSREKDNNNHSDTDSINKDEEILKLKQKIRSLENTVSLQQLRINAIPTIPTNPPQIATVTPNGKTKDESIEDDQFTPDNRYARGLDEIDLIKKFNLLYTSKRNTKNQFPIIYQISVMSWLFIIKNDSYLNDLWIKIFNLRKCYEQQYTVTNGNESTKKILELSKQTNSFISNIKNASGNFATKQENELDFNNYDFDDNKPKNEKQVKPEDVLFNQEIGAPVSLKRTRQEDYESLESEKCPVTGSMGKCPVQHESKPKLTSFRKAPHTNVLSNLQCPMLRPNGGLIQLALAPKCPLSNSDLAKFAEDEDNEDSKICPLMIGDARNVFRERLRNLSHKSHTDSFGGNGCPVIGCDSNTSKRRKNSSKKIRAVMMPTDIKSINFTNSREVISVFERHLPSRKVSWLLIDRFFEKLYIHFPIIDEYSFRERVAKIIGDRDSAPGQKIKLTDLVSDYNEDFLNLCLTIIILRLSWLTLPSNLPKKFSQTTEKSQELTAEERFLIKPENMIPMVLIDLIKEIFTDVRILTTPSVIILQVGMFLKFYNVSAPEDGFELDDSYNGSSHSNGVSPDKEALNLNSSVFLNSLISLAKTIGLNRDPLAFKNFQSTAKDESVNIHLFRRRHLWRKMWYALINLNVLTNISLGDYSKHLNIEIDDNENDEEHGDYNKFWDTKRPSTVEIDMLQKCFPDYSGNLDSNYKRELQVVNLIDIEYKINVLIYKGMKLMLNIKSLPLRSDLDNIWDQLAAFVHEGTEGGGGLNSELTRDKLLIDFDTTIESELSASVRIFKFKLCLVVKMLMFVLNYILFLNYELKLKQLATDNDLDIKRIGEDPSYLLGLDPQLVEVIEHYKKIYNTYFERTLLLAIDNYNIFVQFFDNSDKFFPNLGGELLVYPFLMILNHRSKQFIISLVLRLQQNDPIISQILALNGINKDELLDKLFSYLSIFLSKLDKLTKHYYYAWRLKKLMKFFYNILISSSKIFTSNYTKMLAKSGNPSDQCPVLLDIKSAPVPILPNQRRQALQKKDAERQSQKLIKVMEEDQSDLPQTQVPEHDELPTNGFGTENTNDNFGQSPSEFANQVFNGISEDTEREASLADNAQFELWDELMFDNFPIVDKDGGFSAAPGLDYLLNDGFSNMTETNYGANEIDFTNVDLNTLSTLNQSQMVPGGEMPDTAKHTNSWFQPYQ